MRKIFTNWGRLTWFNYVLPNLSMQQSIRSRWIRTIACQATQNDLWLHWSIKKSEKIQGGLIHIPCTRHSFKTANENFQTLAKTPWMHRSLHNIWGWYFNKCFYFVAGKPIRILILYNFVRTSNSMDLNMANFWWLHMFQFSEYLMAKMKWIPSHIHQSKKMLFPSCYSVDYIHQHVPSA